MAVCRPSEANLTEGRGETPHQPTHAPSRTTGPLARPNLPSLTHFAATATPTTSTTPASTHSQHNLSLIFAHLAFHRGAGVVHERRQPQLPARFPVGGRDHVVPVGGAERIAVGRKARGPGGVARGCPAGGDRSAAAEGVVPVNERNGIARKTSSDKKNVTRRRREVASKSSSVQGSTFQVESTPILYRGMGPKAVGGRVRVHSRSGRYRKQFFEASRRYAARVFGAAGAHPSGAGTKATKRAKNHPSYTYLPSAVSYPSPPTRSHSIPKARRLP